MTDQQIKNRANEIEEEKLREEKRKNKEKEKLEGGKLQESREQRASNERLGKRGQAFGLLGNVIGAGARLIGSNHPKWYCKDKLAVHAAANISFDTPIGYAVPKADDLSGFGVSVNDDQSDSIPLIQTIAWMPSIGGAGPNFDIGMNTEINRAANLMYDYIRNHNSGAKNYDIPDLLMLLTAALEPREFYAEIRRLVTVLNGPITQNASTPKELIQALGYDYQDLVDHKMDLKGFVEQMGIDLKMIPIPKILSVAERQMWLQSNVFKDSDTVRAQLIAFKREQYFYYDWANGRLRAKTSYVDPISGNVTGLSGSTWAATQGKTYTLIKAYGEELFSQVQRDPAIGNIVGDMLKAFGADNLYFTEPGVLDERIEYIYDENVLDQIDNAVAVGCLSPLYFEIDQDSNGYLRQGYYSSAQDRFIPIMLNGSIAQTGAVAAKSIGTLNLFVNSKHDSPSEEDVMVKTRLMAQPGRRVYIDSSGNETYQLYVKSSGSEVVTWISYWWSDPGTGLLYEMSMNSFPTTFIDGQTFIANGQRIERVGRVQQFEHHPVLYPIVISGSGNVEVLDCQRDYTNYAIVKDTTIANMHRVALMSEWGIPDVIAK